MIETKEEVEVDNTTSDTDDSGTFIEEEVDSDGNETESGISSNQESGISSNQHDERKGAANTSSTSAGGKIQANQKLSVFSYFLRQKFIIEISFQFFVDFFIETRNVDWSPKVEFDNPKLKDRMGVIISSAAKKYIKNVESTQSEKHGQYTKSRGKLLFDYEYILQTS